MIVESRRITDVNWSPTYVGTIYHEEIKNKAKLEAKEFDMSQATSREEEQQNLLNFLKQSPKGNNKEQTQAFLYHLTGDTFKAEEHIEEMFNRSKEDIGLLGKYAGANLDLEMFLESFFRLAKFFGAIPESSKVKIQDSLQIAQRYLYNQSGNIDNSFKVGDYVISFEDDPSFTDPFLYGGNFSISYQKPDELLTSLASNFDSTQSFFDILDKREQLEKQNQELHNKQSFNGIYIR
ncbi:hypothetical protein [uncultured Helicobacter sp.]|uniref:hypothetical protein n=1 Tax=uncultured Helicobacter sp. TaxID=175537 RepID=UPI002619C0AD|nr:hypothetical protein [uncultured Helicobacter sp.]